MYADPIEGPKIENPRFEFLSKTERTCALILLKSKPRTRIVFRN